jgi:hypothetical protein
MQRWLTLLFLLTGIHQVFAQNLEMRVVGTGTIEAGTIISRQKVDVNAMPVAGIRIITTLPGLKFDSNNGIVGSVESGPGYYLLYLSTTERKIKVYSPNHKPLDIILPDVGIRLKAQEVWRLEITGEKKLDILPVNFLVEPADAILKIDNVIQTKTDAIQLTVGKHTVEVSKLGFRTVTEEIEVSASKNLYRYSLKRVEQVGISIRSNPPGAEVRLDGVSIGRTTPYQDFKYPGVYSVTLSLPGFVDHVERLVLEENVPNTERTITLKKNEGTLAIESAEKDFQLYINQELKTGTRFLLRPGKYSVRAVKTGFLPSEDSVLVPLGGEILLKLNWVKNAGFLFIDRTPTDAQIFVDGNPVLAPTGQLELAPGTYTIRVSKLGWTSWEETVTILRGKTVSKKVELTNLQGKLGWQVSPANAQILLNKQPIAATGNLELVEGQHTVEISLDGFDPISEVVTIERGRTVLKTWQLKQHLGALRFLVDPVDARVVLTKQNKEIATWTGLKILSDLPVGEYVVSVSQPGFQSQKRTIRVTRDKTEQINVTLLPTGMSPVLQSVLVPGWGDRTVRGKTTAGYGRMALAWGSLAAGALYLKAGNTAYNAYLTETDISKIDAAYSKANQLRQVGFSLLGLGTAVWVYDIQWVARRKNRRGSRIALEQPKNNQIPSNWVIMVNPLEQKAGVRYVFGK